MNQTIKLTAYPRAGIGTGPARAVRREAKIPAIIYGAGAPNQPVSVDAKGLIKSMQDPTFFSRIISLENEAGKAEQVLARDVQVHPVTDRPLHVDFLRIDDTTRVNVLVALHFFNHDKSPGLKRGALLNVVAHQVEVKARPKDIPAKIDIDLSGRGVGTSIHLSDLSLGEGVELAYPERGNLTVATIVPPKRSKMDAAEETAE